jgi:colicin import membrane protein
MRRSPGIGHEPSLKRLAITSLILHLFLISVLIIPFRTGEREFRSYNVNLVEPVTARKEERSSAEKARNRVPAKKKNVAKKKSPRKRALPSKKVVKKEPQPDKESSKASAEKITKEIERLRVIKALSKNKADKEKTHDIEVIRKRLSDQSVTGSGAPGDGKNIVSDSYYALIKSKIKSEWIHPGFKTEGLVVIISINIGSDGKILSRTVEKTSGNMFFDSSAVKAISKASPLPPPPPHVEKEITMRFHL